jgi:hypothetical protein
MALQHFSHQAVQGTTTRGHELKHTGALLFTVERTLNGFHLSPNPPNSAQELLFVFCCVCHGKPFKALYYTGVYYNGDRALARAIVGA